MTQTTINMGALVSEVNMICADQCVLYVLNHLFKLLVCQLFFFFFFLVCEVGSIAFRSLLFVS